MQRHGMEPVQPGQILLLQQAQQIAALTEQCRALTGLLAKAGRGGTEKRINPEVAKLRDMTIERYAHDHYLPGRNHLATGATAEITRDLCKKLDACFRRKILVREARDELVERFRNWFVGEVAGSRLSAATANKYLRQLRAVCGYAARKKVIRRLSPIDFLKEEDPEVNAWTAEESARIEHQARLQVGMVGSVAASVFWTAWYLVAQKLGCRVTAQMLTRREDYDWTERALLLRRKNQKQKKDQRIALPPRAAVAIERLLESHDNELIFGVWPYDPPLRSGRRKWKVLAKHFAARLVEPAGLTLQRGVKTRQLRRTAATMCGEAGGNPQELLGHSSPKTTERYKDKKRQRACRQSFFVPDASPQKLLF